MFMGPLVQNSGDWLFNEFSYTEKLAIQFDVMVRTRLGSPVLFRFMISITYFKC